MELATGTVREKTGCGRLLLVEDEPPIRELIAYNLRREGYEVTAVGDAESALRAGRKNQTDLILLDLNLPDLDGISLCEILRRHPETATIPIMMLTAWSSEGSRILGMEAGADDYMTKPFSPRELSLRVKRLMGTRHKPRECKAQPGGTPAKNLS